MLDLGDVQGLVVRGYTMPFARHLLRVDDAADGRVGLGSLVDGNARIPQVTMEVLSSRILVWPTDLARSQACYGDVLGLTVYGEFGPPKHRGVVYFLGNRLLQFPVMPTSAAAEPPTRPGRRGGACCAAGNGYGPRSSPGCGMTWSTPSPAARSSPPGSPRRNSEKSYQEPTRNADRS